MFSNMDILVFTRFGAMLFSVSGLIAGFCFSRGFTIKEEEFSFSRFAYILCGVFVLVCMAFVVELHNPIVGGG